VRRDVTHLQRLVLGDLGLGVFLLAQALVAMLSRVR
jgi:hypothetical protein